MFGKPVTVFTGGGNGLASEPAVLWIVSRPVKKRPAHSICVCSSIEPRLLAPKRTPYHCPRTGDASLEVNRISLPAVPSAINAPSSLNPTRR